MGTDIFMRAEFRESISERWTADPEFLYRERCYSLYAALADVRNHYSIEPISEPRGFPEDLSEEVRKWHRENGCGHSASWLTLAEIEAYDWDQPLYEEGWISAETYRKWSRSGHPDTWAGGVGGGNVRHVSQDEMDAWIAKGCPRDGIERWMLVAWSEPLRARISSEWWDRTLPRLRSLGRPEDVRIVFDFDS